MSRAIRYALSLIVLVCVAGAPAQAAAEFDLGGTYVVQGGNHDGTDQREFVQIMRHGESFVVRWIRADVSDETVELELVSVGIGIVSGKVLAVSFYSLSNAGVAAFEIEEDGKRLVGQWTAEADDGTVHAQTLIRLRDHTLDPTAGVTSRGPRRGLPIVDYR